MVVDKIHSFDNEENSVKLTLGYSAMDKILQTFFASNVFTSVYKSSLFAQLLMYRDIKVH